MAGLWLLRHGALPPNPERRFVGARDMALTDAGREQIRRAARALLADCGRAVEPSPQFPSPVSSASPLSEDGTGRPSLPRPATVAAASGAPLLSGAASLPEPAPALPHLPRRIICSDLDRCRESAALVQDVFQSRGHRLEIIPDAGLREISLGLWEGLTKAGVEARWPGGLAARGADMARFAPPEGESFATVQARALACVRRWQARCPGECLLLVSHAGVLRTLLAHWLALPLTDVMRIPQHYACRIWLPDGNFGRSLGGRDPL